MVHGRDALAQKRTREHLRDLANGNVDRCKSHAHGIGNEHHGYGGGAGETLEHFRLSGKINLCEV